MNGDEDGTTDDADFEFRAEVFIDKLLDLFTGEVQ